MMTNARHARMMQDAYEKAKGEAGRISTAEGRETDPQPSSDSHGLDVIPDARS